MLQALANSSAASVAPLVDRVGGWLLNVSTALLPSGGARRCAKVPPSLYSDVGVALAGITAT